LVVAWSPLCALVACELPVCSAVVLDCALALKEVAIAAAIEAPSRPFNSLCIVMFIS